MESLQFKQQFLKEIRKTFNYGGLNCSFTERELSDFHNFLEKDFPYDEPGRVKKGVACVGRQGSSSSSSVWVLNEEIQIDENGELFSLQSSDYVWLPIGGPCIELLYARANNQVDLRSTIETPLSVDPLRELVQGMRKTFKHNFIPSKLHHECI